MQFIEEVQIPLLVMPPPKICRLVKWHVRDGSRITIGESMFDLEVDGVMWQVESIYTGFIKIIAQANSIHEVGACVASIVCEEDREDYRTIGIDLPSSLVSALDMRRGEITRSVFLSALLVDALSEAKQISEDATSNGE
jgi:pyruvate/2-oxoglutarate dehydrogenase complex dihydrolipoamide acyltransferase (E2) component